MPTLRNPKHERFAQLVASGMTAQAAFTQAGYPSPQNAPRLRNNELVAKRIEELQARNQRKAEMAALSRDELIGILTEIVHAARNRLQETRTADGLKAAEMVAKMCGWNEPERVNVQSVEVKVDAALIEQLKAGHAALLARAGAPAIEGVPLALQGRGVGAGISEAEATSASHKCESEISPEKKRQVITPRPATGAPVEETRP
jgi:phage terminase small subunit